MKLKATLAVTLMILTGCTTELTEARAKYQCKDLGGVYTVKSLAMTVTCNNGSKFKITEEPLPKGWRVGESE